MRPITYWAMLEQHDEGYLVTFPDVPQAISQGDDLIEARINARDALAVALEGYLSRGLDLPAASAWPGDGPPVNAGVEAYEAPVQPVLAARLLLAQAMRAEGLNKVGLAQRLGCDEKVVRRILSGQGASFDLVLKALSAVGVKPALAA